MSTPIIETMDGLPIKEATTRLMVVLSEADFAQAVPGNAERCAIALGCQRQLATPYVHIMRSRAYVALPDKAGVSVRGLRGKWAHHRFYLSASARKAIIGVDTGTVDPVGVVVELVPPGKNQTREGQREMGRKTHYKRHTGARGGIRGKGTRNDVLTLMGVRNYTNKVPH